jgi:hypothetical protein
MSLQAVTAEAERLQAEAANAKSEAVEVKRELLKMEAQAQASLDLNRQLEELRAGTVDLKRQRDELLTALKVLYDSCRL